MDTNQQIQPPKVYHNQYASNFLSHKLAKENVSASWQQLHDAGVDFEEPTESHDYGIQQQYSERLQNRVGQYNKEQHDKFIKNTTTTLQDKYKELSDSGAKDLNPVPVTDDEKTLTDYNDYMSNYITKYNKDRQDETNKSNLTNQRSDYDKLSDMNKKAGYTFTLPAPPPDGSDANTIQAYNDKLTAAFADFNNKSKIDTNNANVASEKDAWQKLYDAGDKTFKQPPSSGASEDEIKQYNDDFTKEIDRFNQQQLTDAISKTYADTTKAAKSLSDAGGGVPAPPTNYTDQTAVNAWATSVNNAIDKFNRDNAASQDASNYQSLYNKYQELSSKGIPLAAPPSGYTDPDLKGSPELEAYQNTLNNAIEQYNAQQAQVQKDSISASVGAATDLYNQLKNVVPGLRAPPSVNAGIDEVNNYNTYIENARVTYNTQQEDKAISDMMTPSMTAYNKLIAAGGTAQAPPSGADARDMVAIHNWVSRLNYSIDQFNQQQINSQDKANYDSLYAKWSEVNTLATANGLHWIDPPSPYYKPSNYGQPGYMNPSYNGSMGNQTLAEYQASLNSGIDGLNAILQTRQNNLIQKSINSMTPTYKALLEAGVAGLKAPPTVNDGVDAVNNYATYLEQQRITYNNNLVTAQAQAAQAAQAQANTTSLQTAAQTNSSGPLTAAQSNPELAALVKANQLSNIQAQSAKAAVQLTPEQTQINLLRSQGVSETIIALIGSNKPVSSPNLTKTASAVVTTQVTDPLELKKKQLLVQGVSPTIVALVGTNKPVVTAPAPQIASTPNNAWLSSMVSQNQASNKAQPIVVSAPKSIVSTPTTQNNAWLASMVTQNQVSNKVQATQVAAAAKPIVSTPQVQNNAWLSSMVSQNQAANKVQTPVAAAVAKPITTAVPAAQSNAWLASMVTQNQSSNIVNAKPISSAPLTATKTSPVLAANKAPVVMPAPPVLAPTYTAADIANAQASVLSAQKQVAAVTANSTNQYGMTSTQWTQYQNSQANKIELQKVGPLMWLWQTGGMNVGGMPPNDNYVGGAFVPSGAAITSAQAILNAANQSVANMSAQAQADEKARTAALAQWQIDSAKQQALVDANPNTTHSASAVSTTPGTIAPIKQSVSGTKITATTSTLPVSVQKVNIASGYTASGGKVATVSNSGPLTATKTVAPTPSLISPGTKLTLIQPTYTPSPISPVKASTGSGPLTATKTAPVNSLSFVSNPISNSFFTPAQAKTLSPISTAAKASTIIPSASLTPVKTTTVKASPIQSITNAITGTANKVASMIQNNPTVKTIEKTVSNITTQTPLTPVKKQNITIQTPITTLTNMVSGKNNTTQATKTVPIISPSTSLTLVQPKYTPSPISATVNTVKKQTVENPINMVIGTASKVASMIQNNPTVKTIESTVSKITTPTPVVVTKKPIVSVVAPITTLTNMVNGKSNTIQATKVSTMMSQSNLTTLKPISNSYQPSPIAQTVNTVKNQKVSNPIGDLINAVQNNPTVKKIENNPIAQTVTGVIKNVVANDPTVFVAQKTWNDINTALGVKPQVVTETKVNKVANVTNNGLKPSQIISATPSNFGHSLYPNIPLTNSNVVDDVKTGQVLLDGSGYAINQIAPADKPHTVNGVEVAQMNNEFGQQLKISTPINLTQAEKDKTLSEYNTLVKKNQITTVTPIASHSNTIYTSMNSLETTKTASVYNKPLIEKQQYVDSKIGNLNEALFGIPSLLGNDNLKKVIDATSVTLTPAQTQDLNRMLSSPNPIVSSAAKAWAVTADIPSINNAYGNNSNGMGVSAWTQSIPKTNIKTDLNNIFPKSSIPSNIISKVTNSPLGNAITEVAQDVYDEARDKPLTLVTQAAVLYGITKGTGALINGGKIIARGTLGTAADVVESGASKIVSSQKLDPLLGATSKSVIKGASSVTSGSLNLAAKAVNPVVDTTMMHSMANSAVNEYKSGDLKSVVKDAALLAVGVKPFERGSSFAENAIKDIAPKFYDTAARNNYNWTPLTPIVDTAKKATILTGEATGVIANSVKVLDATTQPDRVPMKFKGEIVDSISTGNRINLTRSTPRNIGSEVKLSLPSYDGETVNGKPISSSPRMYASLDTGKTAVTTTQFLVAQDVNGGIVRVPSSDTLVNKARSAVDLVHSKVSPKTYSSITKMEGVQTVELPKDLATSVRDSMTKKGNFLTEYKDWETLAQDKANKTGEPVAIPSPKTANGVLQPENEVVLVFPRDSNYISGKSGDFVKVASKSFAGVSKEGYPITKVSFGSMKKPTSLVTNLVKNIEYNYNLGVDRNGIYNKYDQAASTADAIRKDLELSGQALHLPGSSDYGQHGIIHTNNVTENMLTLKSKNSIPTSDSYIDDLGYYHDITKVGPMDQLYGGPHALSAARAIRSGELPGLKGKDQVYLNKLANDISTHTKIKPLNVSNIKEGLITQFITRPNIDQKLLATGDRLDITRGGAKLDESQLFDLSNKPSLTTKATNAFNNATTKTVQQLPFNGTTNNLKISIMGDESAEASLVDKIKQDFTKEDIKDTKNTDQYMISDKLTSKYNTDIITKKQNALYIANNKTSEYKPITSKKLTNYITVNQSSDSSYITGNKSGNYNTVKSANDNYTPITQSNKNYPQMSNKSSDYTKITDKKDYTPVKTDYNGKQYTPSNGTPYKSSTSDYKPTTSDYNPITGYKGTPTDYIGGKPYTPDTGSYKSPTPYTPDNGKPYNPDTGGYKQPTPYTPDNPNYKNPTTYIGGTPYTPDNPNYKNPTYIGGQPPYNPNPQNYKPDTPIIGGYPYNPNPPNYKPPTIITGGYPYTPNPQNYSGGKYIDGGAKYVPTVNVSGYSGGKYNPISGAYPGGYTPVNGDTKYPISGGKYDKNSNGNYNPLTGSYPGGYKPTNGGGYKPTPQTKYNGQKGYNPVSSTYITPPDKFTPKPTSYKNSSYVKPPIPTSSSILKKRRDTLQDKMLKKAIAGIKNVSVNPLMNFEQLKQSGTVSGITTKSTKSSMTSMLGTKSKGSMIKPTKNKMRI